jgi:hypothetical protein
MALTGGEAAADPTDEFVRGLLDRGLVQVAEHEALRQLNDPLLKPVGRVEWSIRLAQSYLRHAAQVGGDDRESLAGRAEAVLTEVLAVQPPLPRREAVQVQLALVRAERADWQAEEVVANSLGEPKRGAAVTALGAAIKMLRDTQGQLDPTAAARRTAEQLAAGELHSGEVRRLQREIERQLAGSLVSLVELLPEGDQRAAAVREADGRLQDLADGWVGDLNTWEARLLRVRLARLQGEHDRAVSLVTGALKDQPARWLADQFVAEQARSQLAAGQIDVALQTLLAHGRSAGVLGDELRAVQIEALLAARRLAEQRGDQTTANDLWNQAEVIARNLPGAWGSQAQGQLDRAKEAARYGAAVAQLVQSARGAYQAGDVEGSLALFQQAAERAVTDGQPLAADELEYTRGSMLIAAERFRDAADVLARLIARSPYGPKTQDADLLRAYAVGRLYSAGPAPDLERDYVASLTQHREKYTGTPSAGEATWMLAAFNEAQQQWTQALTLYSTLVEDAARGPAARARVAALYEQILATLRGQAQPVDEWEDRAAQDIAAFVRRQPAAVSEWTAADADMSLRLVRLVLEHREHLYTEADKLLTPVQQAGELQRRAAERDGRPLDPEWARVLQTAAQWRMISLAGQGRIDDARRVFQELSAADPASLLRLLKGLSSLAAVIPAEHRAELAHLQLDAAQQLRLQQPDLSPADKHDLDAAIADAYLAAGNILNALPFYERLLQENPRHRDRLRTVAELRMQLGDPDSLQRAKGYWQRVEKLEQRGSPAWLEARLQVADCAVRLGEKADARKLVALTRLVYPQLGGPELKSRFEAVERAASP